MKNIMSYLLQSYKLIQHTWYLHFIAIDSMMNEPSTANKNATNSNNSQILPSEAECCYIQQPDDYKIRVLLAMAIGFPDIERYTTNVSNIVQRSSSLSIRDITPTAVQLVDEIKRRAMLLRRSNRIEREPKPKNWSNGN